MLLGRFLILPLCYLIQGGAWHVTYSVYFFWSYHSAQKDVYDFHTSGKNVQRLFDYAKEAGIWIIARAGPYCNAETNAGGLALWGSDGSLGTLRTSDETYHQAWLPWVTNVGQIIAANEITKGGVYSPSHLLEKTLMLFSQLSWTRSKTNFKRPPIRQPTH